MMLRSQRPLRWAEGVLIVTLNQSDTAPLIGVM